MLKPKNRPLDETDADYLVLLKAYQGMVPENFQRLVDVFIAANRNLNAKSLRGQTFLQHVLEHKRSEAYAEILKKAGAEL